MFERGNPYGKTDPTGHASIYPASAFSNKDGLSDNFVQRVIAIWVIGYYNEQAKKEANLQKELTQKYSDPTGKTCFGCTADGPPSFEYLQKEELQKEFDLLINENKKIAGYTYKGETVKADSPSSIAGSLAEKGFKKHVVKQEVKKIYEEKTGESYFSRWWSIFNSITLRKEKAKESKKTSSKV